MMRRPPRPSTTKNPFASILIENENTNNNSSTTIITSSSANPENAGTTTTMIKSKSMAVPIIGTVTNTSNTAPTTTATSILLSEDSDNNSDDRQQQNEDNESVSSQASGASSSSSSSNNSSRSSQSTTRTRKHDQPKRNRPPRPSMIKTLKLSQQHQQRRRRRSSARFLNLRTNDTTSNPDQPPSQQQSTVRQPTNQNLAEIYQKAIRMNAENKINAGNSWNLHLIENIDMFLEDDDNDDMNQSDRNGNTTNSRNSNAANGPYQEDDTSSSTNNNNKMGSTKTINFTKASCTLDASVKIYSYRVDDVHLTSYKVLANLNRTDHTKSTSTEDMDGSNDPNNKKQSLSSNSSSPTTTTRNNNNNNKNNCTTLETNLANINLNKLDSAFDIDPLFHKMSKTFDEGGARGLLLVNLGVGEHGCNIVFDSSENDTDELLPLPAEDTDIDKHRLPEGMIDISGLQQKLESLLLEDNTSGDNHLATMPLVPQLTGLRAEHGRLDTEGYVDFCMPTVGPKTPGRRRYQVDMEEERDAERTIHKEYENRHRSLGPDNSIATRLWKDEDDNEDVNTKDHTLLPKQQYDDDDGLVDFGGGFDDGVDDDDNDGGFSAYIENHGTQYSENSFLSEEYNKSSEVATATRLIDAIASGQTVLAESDYSYFSNTINGNFWAGAAHWKLRTNKKTEKKKPINDTIKTKVKKGTKSKLSLVPLDVIPDLSHLFGAQGKRKTALSTQLSKAVITKLTQQENLLPEDAGYKMEQLTQLFLCPKFTTTMRRSGGNDDGMRHSYMESLNLDKTVNFALPEMDGQNDYDNDNDGAGFDFGVGNDDDENDGDDFVVQELEGVRKVAKVQVGYAMVSKKVDVKRLKNDLWIELEERFGKRIDSINTDNDQDSVAVTTNQLDHENNGSDNVEEKEDFVSFQDTVNDLEQQRTQMDVTLPFYFICILHLANEKGLRLESQGLDDFTIHSS